MSGEPNDGPGMSQDPDCPAGQHKCKGVCVSSMAVETCGVACEPCAPPKGGTAVCDGIKCSGQCPAGQRDCLGTCQPSDAPCGGCEAGKNPCNGTCVLATSLDACGSACAKCPTDPNGTAACDGNKCDLTCKDGYHRCGDRCLPNNDTGSCGTSCVPCPAPTGATVTCTNGTCDFQCPGGQKCMGKCIGTNEPCGDGCPTGLRKCGAQCVPGNCCGNDDCSNGFACVSNQCSTSQCAQSGQIPCGGRCIACPNPANGQAACMNGECQLTGCSGGFRACNGACISDAQPCGNACGSGRVNCSGTCVEGNCCNDGACSNGFACVSNRCSTSQCADSSQRACGGRCATCPSGGNTGCSGSNCVLTSCSSSGTRICNGACIPDSQPCNGSCGQGRVNCSGTCIPGNCCGERSNCGQNGVCIGNNCRECTGETNRRCDGECRQCCSDAHCDAKCAQCDPSNGRCVPRPDPNNERCYDERGVGGSCMECRNMRCVALLVEKECSSGYGTCRGGKCRPCGFDTSGVDGYADSNKCCDSNLLSECGNGVCGSRSCNCGAGDVCVVVP